MGVRIQISTSVCYEGRRN